jgi:hypothetical protein
MKKVTTLAIACATALLASCSMTVPLCATGNPVGKKVGTAKATMVLGLCFGGDASIMTAANRGGITKISTVDVKKKNILGIIMSIETMVSGE